MKVSIELTPKQSVVLQEVAKLLAANKATKESAKEAEPEMEEPEMEEEEEDEEEVEAPEKKPVELNIDKKSAQALVDKLNKILG